MIVIYGNFLFDKIIEVGNSIVVGDSHQSLNIINRRGGAWNVARAIMALNDSMEFRCYGPEGEATVFCSLPDASKTSVVDWGYNNEYEFSLHEEKVDWQHIAYLDRLPTLTPDHIKEMRKYGPVSADLCCTSYTYQEQQRVYDLLKEVDYLIASDTEYLRLFGVVADCVTRKSTTIHSPGGSVTINNDDAQYRIQRTPRVDVNVLGAGDWFAGAFILSMIKGSDLEKSLYFAHEETEKMIDGKYSSAYRW